MYKTTKFWSVPIAVTVDIWPIHSHWRGSFLCDSVRNKCAGVLVVEQIWWLNFNALSGVFTFQPANTPMHQCSYVPRHQHNKVTTRHCTNALMHLPANAPTHQHANAPASKDNCTSVMLVSCLKPRYCWEHIAQKEFPASNIQQGHVHFNSVCFLSETVGDTLPSKRSCRIGRFSDWSWQRSTFPNSHLPLQHPFPPATSPLWHHHILEYFHLCLWKESSKTHLSIRHLWQTTVCYFSA